MTLRLDHIVISVQDLPQAITNYRDLGFTVTRGGKHTSNTTENALVAFADGTYIELLTPTDDAPSGVGMDFTPLVNPHDGLTGFALLSSDLEADAARIKQSEFAVQDIVPGNRQKPDGTEIRWKLATIGHMMSPFFIQDVTARNLRVSTAPEHVNHKNGVQGIWRLRLLTANMESAQQRYTLILGASPEVEDSDLMYTLPGCEITLTKAATDEHRKHLQIYGEAPYEITFGTTSTNIPAGNTHGARLQFLNR